MTVTAILNIRCTSKSVTVIAFYEFLNRFKSKYPISLKINMKQICACDTQINMVISFQSLFAKLHTKC